MIYIAENNNIGISIIGWTIECICCSSIRNFFKFFNGRSSREEATKTDGNYQIYVIRRFGRLSNFD